jgi:hypothetical protein
MKVIVEKLTDSSLLRRACAMTLHSKKSGAGLDMMYKSEHSPIRTQIFWVEMLGIPTFVSVHFVRHKVGVEHFVMSNREDRPGHDVNVTRWTPVNHGMFCNAQALINMAKPRLCNKASKETREVMRKIKEGVYEADPYLFKYLVPTCVYRGGICPEPISCGFNSVYSNVKKEEE